MKGATREAHRALVAIAGQQQGFFTARQAKEAGYVDASHGYHVRAGNWIREERGIYRLADYPAPNRPDLVLWTLWSRDRNDVPQGVFSHQTSLALHDLAEFNPAKLHMTVPRRFRRSRPAPAVLVLHHSDLAVSEIGSMDGYRVTRPMKAILDLLASGEVPLDELRAALREGLSRGTITLDEHQRAAGQLASLGEGGEA